MLVLATELARPRPARRSLVLATKLAILATESEDAY